VSGKYIVAFAGTDDVQDIIVDIWQGVGAFTLQYDSALRIGRGLADVPNFSGNTVVTGHSLGGGLASAASVVSGFNADTFNSAGLLRSTLQKDEQGNTVLGDPSELWRYDNASLFIDAYYLDWDILSFVQDSIPGLQDAIGYRREMDGPLDLEIGIHAALLAAQFASGAGWATIFLNLGQIGIEMATCHTTYYYQYALMVDKSTGWYIYGYNDF